MPSTISWKIGEKNVVRNRRRGNKTEYLLVFFMIPNTKRERQRERQRERERERESDDDDEKQNKQIKK